MAEVGRLETGAGDKLPELLRELGGAPLLYPMKFGPLLHGLLMIRMTESAYREASFLDNRFAIADKQAGWAAQPLLAEALAGGLTQRPLHFIFHIGHAGSTLLSRLLDETGQVLSLREPLPLCTMADVQDVLTKPESPVNEGQFRANLELLLRLWSRGFAGTQAVVLKSTSSAGRLGPRLMAARPGARALYLHLSAEAYLAQLLAARTEDLKLFAPERIRRLERLLGAPPPPLHSLSLGEIVAMGWLAERLTEREVLSAAGPRALAFDFEAFLRRPEESMTRILGHFGLNASNAFVDNLVHSPNFKRYSKDTRQSYTPEKRTKVIAGSRVTNAAEIRRGLAWLERLGVHHPAVAATLEVAAGSPA